MACLLRELIDRSKVRVRVVEVLRLCGMTRAAYYRGRARPVAGTRRVGPLPKVLSEEQVRLILKAALQHRRLGYKKVHRVLLRDRFRGVAAVSRRDVYRVMRQHRLLKRRRARAAAKEILKLRLRELRPQRPNRLWQMDVTYIWIPRYGWLYQIDVIDYFSRFLLAQHITHSYSAHEGLRAIGKAVRYAEELHGELTEPVFLLTDNGTTFLARRFAWGLKRLLISATGNEKLRHVRIGFRMPEHLGLLERFHGSLKAEEVWTSWYRDPLDARQSLLAYGRYYNFERPHWALGLKTPAEVYLGISWQEVKRRFASQLQAAA